MKKIYLTIACIPLLLMSARAFSLDSPPADKQASDAAQQRGPSTQTSAVGGDVANCTHINPGIRENTVKEAAGDDTKVLDTNGRVSNSADTQKTEPPAKAP